MRNQHNFRLADQTTKHLDDLSKLYGSKTRAVEIAIERLHAQLEKENKMNPYSYERKIYYCQAGGHYWYTERDDTHDWSEPKYLCDADSPDAPEDFEEEKYCGCID